ncbi:MAG: PaaI family thioesterase [Alphaproteobacteria bacterium]|nr:MAG: PaaI family thioesterase [Alphaproteobacteria bacterium]
MFSIIPYFDFLGLRLEMKGSHMICILPEDKKFIGNPTLPALHGGVVGAFLESTALVHLLKTQEVTRLPKIINITVEYLRSAKPVETYAEAVITKPGRRIANMRIEAWQTDRKKPVAAAHANFLVS